MGEDNNVVELDENGRNNNIVDVDDLNDNNRFTELDSDVGIRIRGTGQAGTKRLLDVFWVVGPVKRNVRSRDLDDYYGKSRREYREWIMDAETRFDAAPEYFITEWEKINWAAQFLRDDLKEQ